jgi:hypothetical protein
MLLRSQVVSSRSGGMKMSNLHVPWSITAVGAKVILE